MIRFPDDFVSATMEAKINFNRSLKLQEDRKLLRKKVFESFHNLTEHFTTIEYTFQSDCTTEEIQESYQKIKRELEERKFICRGEVVGKCLHLLLSVKPPKKSNVKWQRALEKVRQQKRALKKKKKKRNNNKSQPNKPQAPTPIMITTTTNDNDNDDQETTDLSPDLIMETGNMMLGGI